MTKHARSFFASSFFFLFRHKKDYYTVNFTCVQQVCNKYNKFKNIRRRKNNHLCIHYKYILKRRYTFERPTITIFFSTINWTHSYYRRGFIYVGGIMLFLTWVTSRALKNCIFFLVMIANFFNQYLPYICIWYSFLNTEGVRSSGWWIFFFRFSSLVDLKR